MDTTVMIVEDEILVALEMEFMLEDAGCTSVGIAADAKSALALAAQTKPDIALVDVNLRDGASGPGIARHLKEICACTVVFVTANPRAIPAPSGAIGVVEKPCNQRDLNEAVAFAMAVRTGKTPPHLHHMRAYI